MIDKDLQNIYRGMVKTTYVPVIRRAIILLLMQDINRMQIGMKLSDEAFLELLHGPSAKKALRTCLDELLKNREVIIQEILQQYGINTNAAMNDFYHEEFNRHFYKQIDLVWRLVYLGHYATLDRYIAGESEH